MAPKKVSFEVKDWMKYGLIAILLFLFSYVMASTIPDCAGCSKDGVNFIQIWHGIMSMTSSLGAIVVGVVTICAYMDGD